jgi:hypothetical protein
MTYLELRQIVEKITYRPSWTIETRQDDAGMWLRVIFSAADPGNARLSHQQHGRNFKISTHMVKSEVVQTAFLAVMIAEEHETRECFRYRGQSIFGPHFDVDKLADLCQQDDAIEARA